MSQCGERILEIGCGNVALIGYNGYIEVVVVGNTKQREILGSFGLYNDLLQVLLCFYRMSLRDSEVDLK